MKKRIISAVCLIPLLILLLDAAPQWSTMVLCILISVIAAYELMKNTGLIQSRRMRGYTYIAAGLIPIGCYFHSSIVGFQMLMLLLCVFLFSEAMLSKGEISHLSIDVCLVAGLMLPFIFSGLIRLSYSDMGKVLVLIPFTIAFTADAGAYFTGIACGKHHFAPTVSPHKTSEGVFGGTTCCVIGMLIFAFIFNITNTQIKASYFAALLYGLLGSFAATFGDLCFSYIKRQVSIKDYGNLIPGHGGILDRFDSISAVLVLTEILINRFPIIG